MARTSALVTLVVAALLAGVFATPAVATDNMTIGAPVVILIGQDEYFARYVVVTDVRTEHDHTRTQWALPYTCDNSTQGLTGYADSDTKKRYFFNQHTEIIVPLGSLCSISATWLVGGGGCSLCDDKKTGPATTFTAPPGLPRRRYDPAEKAAAARLRDSARRQSAKHYAACQAVSAVCSIVAIYDAIAWYQDRIVNDPPDRSYRLTVRLVRPTPKRYLPAEAGSAAPALTALAAAASDVLAAGRAMDTAVDRAQGAAAAKQPKYDRRQMTAARGFAGRMAGALDRFATRSMAASAALATARPAAFATTTDAPAWIDGRASVIASGVAAPLTAELRRLKVPPALLQDTRAALVVVDAVPEGDAAAALADPELLAAERAAAKMLRKWAKRG